jgi:tetratricopeptide (TPR) repeat protein
MPRIGQAGRLALAILLSLAAAPAAAQTSDQAREYADCLARAERTPRATFEWALAWRDEGGGFAARHCAALALVAAGHYPDAADRLEALAEDLQAAGQPHAAATLGQAGNAWLLAGFVERAEAVFSAALRLDPESAELYVDRARAHAAAERYQAAAADLDQALIRAPENVDALVFRASARRRLGQPAEADDDLALALALNPDHVEGLLERGIVRLALGDGKAARRDWLHLLQIAPQGRAADHARGYLQRLDVKSE